MSSRDTILTRIREATADLSAESADIPRAYLRHAPTVSAGDREATVTLMVERLEEYGAEVRRVAAADIPATVAAVLNGQGARSAVIPPGLPEEWLAQWHGLVRKDTPPLPHCELDTTDAVVTTCAAAIAESGTIVLDAGPGQGRRAPTLLPDSHICVVCEDQIASSMPEAITRLSPSRPLTWISGPSATADIEMIRVQGVHGPRRLTVVITCD
ncbi:LutC/YkgG family protein [Streptomyces sp. NPDC002537]